MKNRIVGWLKVDNCVPLTKAFDVRIDFSERFSNIHWQNVEKTFLKLATSEEGCLFSA